MVHKIDQNLWLPRINVDHTDFPNANLMLPRIKVVQNKILELTINIKGIEWIKITKILQNTKYCSIQWPNTCVMKSKCIHLQP
jgi:hypothetical protein